LPLQHEQKTGRAGLRRLVSEEHKAELMFSVNDATCFHLSCSLQFEAISGAVPKFTLNRAHQMVTA